MEIHKTGIVSVLGEEEKDEENVAEEESHEEVKVPLVKRMPSISAKSYFQYKRGRPKPVSGHTSEGKRHEFLDEGVINYDSPSEYGSDEDYIFAKWTLSSQTAESIFFNLGNLKQSLQITLEEFLEIDINYDQEVLWSNLKNKLASPQGLEEHKSMSTTLNELQLNSEIIETAVLRELSQMVFSCIKSKQPLQELCNSFYKDFDHTITQRQLFLIVFRNCDSRL